MKAKCEFILLPEIKIEKIVFAKAGIPYALRLIKACPKRFLHLPVFFFFSIIVSVFMIHFCIMYADALVCLLFEKTSTTLFHELPFPSKQCLIFQSSS